MTSPFWIPNLTRMKLNESNPESTPILIQSQALLQTYSPFLNLQTVKEFENNCYSQSCLSKTRNLTLAKQTNKTQTSFCPTGTMKPSPHPPLGWQQALLSTPLSNQHSNPVPAPPNTLAPNPAEPEENCSPDRFLWKACPTSTELSKILLPGHSSCGVTLLRAFFQKAVRQLNLRLQKIIPSWGTEMHLRPFAPTKHQPPY